MTRRAWIAWSAAHAAAAQTIDDDIRRMSSEAPLELRFRGSTAGDGEAWQRRFRAALDACLGPYQPPAKWETIRKEPVEFDDHVRTELILKSPGLRELPVYLLTPKNLSGPRPGILALHGHGEFGHQPVAGVDASAALQKAIASANYDYGRQLARRGYIVAAPCFTPFGVRLGRRADYRGEDPCAVTFARLQLFGQVLLSENLRDALWALEFLSGQESVDASRLACVGLSLGGRMTMMTAAVSPKIRAAVISGALNMLQERVRGRYSCGAQIIPGLLKYGDVPEISSLIAPRPCLFEVGLKDSLMVKEWIPPALERMRKVWTALGAPGNLDVDSFDGGHRWNGVKAFPLLDRVLSAGSLRA